MSSQEVEDEDTETNVVTNSSDEKGKKGKDKEQDDRRLA